MTNSKPKENPHKRVIEQARETAKSLEILDFIDDLPDMSKHHVEIPFPYGDHGARPNKWGHSKQPDDL